MDRKNNQQLKSFFFSPGCLVVVAMLLLSLVENFSACKKIFLTHSDILLWPHSIWPRIRVAQCAMALRVMVQLHLGWPWDGHGSVHREHPQRVALPSVTAPAPAKPWQAASAMLPALSQTRWPKKYAKKNAS